jgi:hypothetical protein
MMPPQSPLLVLYILNIEASDALQSNEERGKAILSPKQGFNLSNRSHGRAVQRIFSTI